MSRVLCVVPLGSCGARYRAPKKLRGCIAASPNVPIKPLEEAYLFFFAFFLGAILFSSRTFEFHASVAGGARIQSPCIMTTRKLVKRKVRGSAQKREAKAGR